MCFSLIVSFSFFFVFAVRCDLWFSVAGARDNDGLMEKVNKLVSSLQGKTFGKLYADTYRSREMKATGNGL